MRKFIVIVSVAALFMYSCNEKTDPFEISDDTPKPEMMESVTKVLDSESQKAKFKTVSEQLAAEFDSEKMAGALSNLSDISNMDFSKYEGSGNDIQGVINSIIGVAYGMGDNASITYSLDMFRGNYVFANGKFTFSESDGINVNFENLWTISVDFSEESIVALIQNSMLMKEYVSIPKLFNVTVCKKDEEMLKYCMVLDSDLTDFTASPDFATTKFLGKVTVEIAGYKYCITKAGYDRNTFTVNTCIYNGDKVIVSETCSATRGGSADFELNLLGKIQFRATVSDMDTFNGYARKFEDFYQSEEQFKQTVYSMNELLTSGVYFSSDVMQCRFELYPFYSGNKYERIWYVSPVVVLPDGTRFEDINSFFSSDYLTLLLGKYNNMAGQCVSLL